MSEPTRRNVLGIAGGGLAAVLTGARPATAADPPPAAEVFVFRVGTLGDVVREYLKKPKRDLGGPSDLGTVPADKDLYAELDKCPLYLIDARDLSDPKKPAFAKADEFPRLVAGGSLRFEWKGKKGTCVIQIAKLDAALNRTDYTLSPPTRLLDIAVQLATSGETPLLRASSTIGMTTEDVKYDLTGKLLKG